MLLIADLVLATGCFLSTLWGVQFFFSRTGAGWAPGMRLLAILTFGGFGVQFCSLALRDAPEPLALGIAAGLYCAGLALFWISIGIHRRRPPSLAYSLDTPEHLVTWGPYAWIRHPFYTAYMLAWWAGYVASGSLASLAVAVILCIAYQHSARLEERKFAESALHEEYARYVARTGRFLPNPWKVLHAWRRTVKSGSV